jgi:hypothetical protein
MTSLLESLRIGTPMPLFFSGNLKKKKKELKI